jgi:hypothetical protein
MACWIDEKIVEAIRLYRRIRRIKRDALRRGVEDWSHGDELRLMAIRREIGSSRRYQER